MENRILRIVSDYFGVSEDEMKGEGQTDRIATARQFAMVLTRMNTKLSITKIGLFYNREHGTVTAASKAIWKKVKKPNYARDMERLTSFIKKGYDPEDIFLENDFYGDGEFKRKDIKYESPYAHLAKKSTHYQEYIR